MDRTSTDINDKEKRRPTTMKGGEQNSRRRRKMEYRSSGVGDIPREDFC